MPPDPTNPKITYSSFSPFTKSDGEMPICYWSNNRIPLVRSFLTSLMIPQHWHDLGFGTSRSRLLWHTLDSQDLDQRQPLINETPFRIWNLVAREPRKISWRMYRSPTTAARLVGKILHHSHIMFKYVKIIMGVFTWYKSWVFFKMEDHFSGVS